MTLALPAALEATRREFDGRAGRLSFYAAGDGAPLLLIHSINAAGSAFEVKPIFERYRSTRRVYAVDLPGFGFSERSPREYNVQLYVDAILDLLELIREDIGSEPPDALALSLASEFLARTAAGHPARFRTLAFVTPTGFSKGAHQLRAAPGSTREAPGLHRILTVPLWRKNLYGLLTKRSVIRYFLERTWGSKDIDRALCEYDFVTSHQPGAENAPCAFLSGKLFSRDIRDVYERIVLPVFMPHGTRGDFGDFREADWTYARSNWVVQSFNTGALPYFEDPQAFFTAYDRFLASPPGAV